LRFADFGDSYHDLPRPNSFRHLITMSSPAPALSATVDDQEWRRDRVHLDDGFWRSLREHPAPVHEEAVRPIGLPVLLIAVVQRLHRT
jgi:hypothetical protein